MTKIAYLGPEGTFSEQAAEYFADPLGSKLYPLASIEDVFEAVASGKTDYGVVPVENSIEGGVNTTIDSLIFDSDLFIKEQLTLPISHNLMSNAGSKFTKILSHPQALAQCRKFINSRYPEAEIAVVSSTAEAAKIAAGSTEAVAAIGSKKSAELYGLKIIHENIQENKNNTTQFILLTKTDTSEPKDGCSTLVAFSTEDQPGALYRVLDIFAVWDLNMTKIMSRPTKNRHGEYVFFVELSEYENVADVADALTMIKRKTTFFKNLGSYKTTRI